MNIIADMDVNKLNQIYLKNKKASDYLLQSINSFTALHKFVFFSQWKRKTQFCNSLSYLKSTNVNISVSII